MEQDVFLRDHGDLFAQRANGDVANVDAVDANLPGGEFVETRNQIDERGFSGAAGADQRDHFARCARSGECSAEPWTYHWRRKSRHRRKQFRGKRAARFSRRAARLVLRQIEIGEDLRARSLRGLELLIDLPMRFSGV